MDIQLTHSEFRLLGEILAKNPHLYRDFDASARVIGSTMRLSELTDETAILISDALTEELAKTGFDEDYVLNIRGRQVDSLLAKILPKKNGSS